MYQRKPTLPKCASLQTDCYSGLSAGKVRLFHTRQKEGQSICRTEHYNGAAAQGEAWHTVAFTMKFLGRSAASVQHLTVLVLVNLRDSIAVVITQHCYNSSSFASYCMYGDCRFKACSSGSTLQTKRSGLASSGMCVIPKGEQSWVTHKAVRTSWLSSRCVSKAKCIRDLQHPKIGVFPDLRCYLPKQEEHIISTPAVEHPDQDMHTNLTLGCRSS